MGKGYDAAEGPAMIYLPSGAFRMGDERGYDKEKPVHPVRLDAFALGRTPVTVGEYLRFCEATNSHWPEWLEVGSQYHLETDKNDYYRQRGVSLNALDLPVVGTSWDDACAYCQWLSEQTGEVYELPTEAQWEYACRAGGDGRWCFGDDQKKLNEYAWYSGNSEGKLHPVAAKAPNVWGLHDMHGNVWEWCSDWYAADYYSQLASGGKDHASGAGASSSDPGERTSDTKGSAGSNSTDASTAQQTASENPHGPTVGPLRVFRGGSWFNVADDCRSAYRYRGAPSYRNADLGFRLSRRV
jgi:formylglycine-generating enzyme required for sulfatase activity